MDVFRDLYQQLIIDHNKNPQNYYVMKNYTHNAEGKNPLCRDEIHIFIHENNGIIKELAFSGSGCASRKSPAIF